MSKIIDLETFRQYCNYEEEGTDDLCNIYIESAENIVSEYLGYSPIVTSYEEIVVGIGSDKLFTRVPHIEEFSYVMEVDNEEILSDLVANEECIYSRNYKEVFEEGKKYKVVYDGGWKKTAIPSDIKMAILRISSLMLTESSGNIGLTSKSNLDTTRSFYNYTNYQKFLQPLLPYRSKAII